MFELTVVKFIILGSILGVFSGCVGFVVYVFFKKKFNKEMRKAEIDATNAQLAYMVAKLEEIEKLIVQGR